MTITLELNADLDERVREQAQTRGLEVEEWITETLQKVVPRRPQQAALDLFKSWEAEDETTDEAEIVARREDWEGVKASLNEAHTSDRVLFP
jgi:hypothetical protein